MRLLDFLQNLQLAEMFAVILAIGLVLCWIILVLVRLSVHRAGLDPAIMLPFRDTMIAAVGAIFALMMAFSAAGIWNDTLQASTAVQREANALENVVALAASLPRDLAEHVKQDVARYGREVAQHDWPAMVRGARVHDRIYDFTDSILVDLINTLAREHGRIGPLPTAATLLQQIVEARSARLSRLMLANVGVSGVQWVAMF